MTTDLSLSDEDAKLVTLARAAATRTQAAQAAAVRDLDGRTYVAAEVRLPSLELDALDLAVAMAVSSGAQGLEAAAMVADPDRLVNLDPVRDLGGEGIAVHLADPSGAVHGVRHT